MCTVPETAINVRPFQVEIPEEQLAELRLRIEATQVAGDASLHARLSHRPKPGQIGADLRAG
jgi:hypothetical protein